VLPSGHFGKNCRSKGVSRVLVDASASGRPSNCCNNSAGGTPQGCIGRLACRAFRRLWLSRNTCAEMRDPKIAAMGFLEGQFTIVMAVQRAISAAADAEDQNEKSVVTPRPLAPARDALGRPRVPTVSDGRQSNMGRR
jgi:hypothetical protein